MMDSRELLYVQIQRDLRTKIEGGQWPIGTKIPPEPELQETYNVSRGTVRRAVDELVRQGYVAKKHGKGTFVRSTSPILQKSELASFTQQLTTRGLAPTTRLLSAGRIRAVEAEGRVREGFALSGEAEVIHIRRLRLGDGVPLAVQSVYLLPASCPGILEQDLSHLFQLYEARYGVRINVADEIIRLGRAAEDEAALLEITPGDPVVVRDRISLAQDGEPFEVLHSVDRGDRFQYRYQIVADSTRLTTDLAIASGDSSTRYARSE
jgi:GntR family transcriptional regulator